jgi:hypothetical protein
MGLVCDYTPGDRLSVLPYRLNGGCIAVPVVKLFWTMMGEDADGDEAIRGTAEGFVGLPKHGRRN